MLFDVSSKATVSISPLPTTFLPKSLHSPFHFKPFQKEKQQKEDDITRASTRSGKVLVEVAESYTLGRLGKLVYARLFGGIKLKRRQQNFPNSRILSCIEVTFMPIFISLGKLK